jgi:uncharacterized OsmC-like protein
MRMDPVHGAKPELNRGRCSMNGATATEATIRNGVNVGDLLGAIEAVTENGSNGRVKFRLGSRWLGGFRARHIPGTFTVGNEQGTHSADHSIVSDEPAQILGTDEGISPAELVLSSLAACLIVGYAANAAALGIDLEDVSVDISTEGSLEGFMNIRNAKPGFDAIAVEVTLTTDAPADALAELHDYVNSHSPIWDTLSSPVRLSSKLNVEPT